jgi:beta-glucosidase
MEMPRACYFDTAPTTSAGFGCTAGQQTVAGAVSAGDLPEAAVDQAVRHVLVQMDRFKLLDGPKVRPSRDRDGGAQVADDVATAGAVLLSNTRNALPLDDRDVRSVAVVGPTAKAPLIGGGGSARVIPESAESPLDALERRAGANAGIEWSPGLDLDGVAVPSSALSPPAGSTGPGLSRSGTGANAGAPSRVDAQIDYTEGGQTPDASLPPGPWEWTGALDVPAEGDYDLSLQFSGGNSALYLDGSTTATVSAGGLFGGGSLIPTADGLTNSSKRVHLTEGSRQIRITATPPTSGSPQFRFAWTSAERRAAAVSAAVRSARGARTAIVFAYDEGTEGADRSSLSLPNDQDGLVSAVTRANPNTIVVLNTGDPVLTPWARDARAILQMWYPGQEGADATAKLLLGDASPSGKLPMTFPVDEDDSAVAGHPERFPGVNDVQEYSEGIFSGYRWHDQQDVAPRFEFGRGLSYTTFDYKDLQIKAVGDTYDVSFKLRNTGDEDGTEVPQVYAGPPSGAPVPMAERNLAGFERVKLEPDEERMVTVRLDARRLGYWSEDADGWVTPAGSKPIYVGSSSRDIRLSGETEPAPSTPGGGTPGGGTPGGATPATRVRCKVPKLKGFTLKRAKARLRKAHCGIGRTKKVRTRRHRAGRVFAQSRKPKWTGPRGTRVRLTVAVKPRRR